MSYYFPGEKAKTEAINHIKECVTTFCDYMLRLLIKEKESEWSLSAWEEKEREGSVTSW